MNFWLLIGLPEAIWLFFMFIIFPLCSLANGEWEGGVKGEIYNHFFAWARLPWFSTSWAKTIVGIAILGLPILLITAGARLWRKVVPV